MNTVSINFDTICAISSPPGIGGISIIRISGLEAFSIAEKIFSKSLDKVNGYQVIYGKIIENDQIIDDVIVTIFKNPQSFTGENIVEINCHGSSFIQQKILQLIMTKTC